MILWAFRSWRFPPLLFVIPLCWVFKRPLHRCLSDNAITGMPLSNICLNSEDFHRNYQESSPGFANTKLLYASGHPWMSGELQRPHQSASHSLERLGQVYPLSCIVIDFALSTRHIIANWAIVQWWWEVLRPQDSVGVSGLCSANHLLSAKTPALKVISQLNWKCDSLSNSKVLRADL